MSYLGDVQLGDILDFKFTTVDATGLPTTLAGSPVVAAYGDNSTTEVTAGITLVADFDGRAGLNQVRLVASGANGYGAPGNYAVVMTAGTVGGVSMVGYTVGHFSIGKRVLALPPVDGVAFADYMESLLAVLFGVAAPSGTAVAFKKRDGTTTKVTVTYGTTDGQRTGSTIS